MAKVEKKKAKKGSQKTSQEVAKKVEFTFYAPEATEVYLSGEFNQWDPRGLPMEKGEDGIWKTTVNLAPGRYEYKLLADNAWVENIPDTEMASNSFGTQNCVLRVK